MLRELLSQKELDMITHYRQLYAGHSYISTERYIPSYDLLSVWEENKTELAKLFGGKLILEKEIEYRVPYDLLIRNMETELLKETLGNVFRQLRNLASNNLTADSGQFSSSSLFYALDVESLIKNKLDIPKKMTIETPGEQKNIDVMPGMKTIKLLSKIAKAFDVSGFEELRLAQSRVTNLKKLKGTLCLSIHPLDYMTMSDNDSDWSSCMSWTEEGCYRQGTVEMMNSPIVLVAYLKSKNDMSIGDSSWNNKKWRCLFIANPMLTVNVKGYPYECPELEQICLDWIAELARKNQNIDYDSSHIFKDSEIAYIKNQEINFNTVMMYNDFSTAKHTMLFSQKEIDKIPEEEEYFSINYSGPAQCMACGTINSDYLYGLDEEEARLLCCIKCENLPTCSHCGAPILGEIYEIEGEYCCECCYEDYTVQDAASLDYIFEASSIRVQVDAIPDYYRSEFFILKDDREEFLNTLSDKGKTILVLSDNDIKISIEQITKETYTKFNLRNFISESCIPDSIKKELFT